MLIFLVSDCQTPLIISYSYYFNKCFICYCWLQEGSGVYFVSLDGTFFGCFWLVVQVVNFCYTYSFHLWLRNKLISSCQNVSLVCLTAAFSYIFCCTGGLVCCSLLVLHVMAAVWSSSNRQMPKIK